MGLRLCQEVVSVIDSTIGAIDALENVISDLTGISCALCYQSTIEGEDLSGVLSRVLDDNIDALRETVDWLKGEAKEPGARIAYQ